MARYWELYRVDGLTPDDPRVAPLRAEDFSGLPNTLIHTAEYDPLRDEGEIYARALRRAGRAVRHTMHTGLIHHFYGLGAVVPAGHRLVQPGDAQALAKSLTEVLELTDRGQAMGEAGRMAVEAFSASQIVPRIESAYIQLLGDRTYAFRPLGSRHEAQAGGS